MTPRRRFVRLAFEPLDGRVLPANLTVTFAAGTLTVVGDAGNNSLIVAGDATTQTHFTLTSSTDTINDSGSSFSTPAGVKNLVFHMGAGADLITFDNTVHITVQGNVSIDGGDGTNSVTAADLTVNKNLSITNGTSTAAQISTTLVNLSVGGNVTIKSAGGDTYTNISRNLAGVSTIKGNVTVTNGTGSDQFLLSDTNVDKNVTVNNGHGSGLGGLLSGGAVEVFNNYDSAFRSLIGGNVTVTYLDGNAPNDGIWDTEVLGNVTFNHGSGAAFTMFDGSSTLLPDLIHGNLSVLGTAVNSLSIGITNHQTGLVVGKNLTLTSGGGSREGFSVSKLQVGGNTSLTLNDGGNGVNIDDSDFEGKFALVSGAGADTLNLETISGTNSATVFRKAVLIDLGAGYDTFDGILTAYNTVDTGEELVIWSTFVVKNWDNWYQQVSQEFFPNGGSIQL